MGLQGKSATGHFATLPHGDAKDQAAKKKKRVRAEARVKVAKEDRVYGGNPPPKPPRTKQERASRYYTDPAYRLRAAMDRVRKYQGKHGGPIPELEVEEWLNRYKEATLCEICEHEIAWNDGCNLDHNHDTGEYRGFLCTQCNTMLGQARDDPRILQTAADYLLNFTL